MPAILPALWAARSISIPAALGAALLMAIAWGSWQRSSAISARADAAQARAVAAQAVADRERAVAAMAAEMEAARAQASQDAAALDRIRRAPDVDRELSPGILRALRGDEP